MYEIVYFIAGSLFTLLLIALCLGLAFKITDYKDNQEIQREVKRKAQKSILSSKGGSVIKPKTLEQIAFEKNEGARAFKELVDS